MTKGKCYDCIHRRECAGSAHSSCAHPKSGLKNASPLMEMMAIFASVGRTGPALEVDGMKALGIGLNPHGVRRGWANWPFNFDPIWLVECTGFEEKVKAVVP
jgi:hypothetical protein